MKLISAALLGLFLTSIAGADNYLDTYELPKQAPSSVPAGYRIFSTLFLDVDKALQDTGFKVESCIFEQNSEVYHRAHVGLGPCLYENYMAASRNGGMVGETYIWVVNKKNQRMPLMINWSRDNASWGKVFREIMSLKFESISSWWAQWVMRNPEEKKPLSYSQSFLGKLRITFPSGADLGDFFDDSSAESFLPKAVHSRHVEIELQPLYKQNGRITYRGKLTFQNEFWSEQPNRPAEVEFVTDINLLKTKRTFKMNGQLKSQDIFGETESESNRGQP